jgi:hypothetical protein
MTAIQLGVNFWGIPCANSGDTPGNPVCAAGPASVLHLATWRAALFDKTGKPLVFDANGITPNIGTQEFFQATSDDDNPRTVFNAITQQFGAAGDMSTKDGYILMTSKSATPPDLTAAAWNRLQVPVGVDFPSLGYNADGWWTSFGTPGQQIAFAPSAGGPMQLLTQAPTLAGGGGLMCEMPDSKPGDPMWVVELGGAGIELWALESPPGSTVSATLYSLALPAGLGVGPSNSARQIGPYGPYYADDDNGYGIVRTINGTKYLFYANDMGDGAKACIILWVIFNLSGSTPTIYQCGTIDLSAQNCDCVCGGCTANNAGTMAFTFLVSSPTTTPAHYVAVKALTDTAPLLANALQGPSGINYGRCGDYPQVCVDPMDQSFWACNNLGDDSVADTYNWHCNIQHFGLAAPATAPLPPPAPSLTLTVSGNVSVQLGGASVSLPVTGCAMVPAGSSI